MTKHIEFTHANGFPASSYRYFLQQFAPHQVHAKEVYGMSEYPVGKNWHGMSKELIAHIESHANYPVIGIGHSFGGVLTLWAAQKRPDLFERVILIDSPIFRPLKRSAISLSQLLGKADSFIPPAKKSKQRRDTFPSKAEALTYFKGKRLFKSFHPTCLEEYVEHGLVDTNDQKVTLRIPVQKEVDIFCACPGKLGKTSAPVPTHYIYAERREVLDDHDVKWLKGAFYQTEFVEFKGGGHMFPLEKPEESAKFIKKIAGLD